MRLALVRHGETYWNAVGKFQGHSPVELNEKGISQARKVAKAIVQRSPIALYSSSLRRALMTATEISREVALPITPLDGMMEANLGEMEGITGEELRTRYPEIHARWQRDPSKLSFPGGESMRQLRDRAWRAFGLIEKAHPEGLVVVVSHSFTIRTILCRFLGLPPSRLNRLRVDLGSISVLETNSGPRHVLTINDKCHL